MNRSTATKKLQMESHKAAQEKLNATPMGILLLRYETQPLTAGFAVRRIAEKAAQDIGKLLTLLTAANAHLKYCNFGDKWERECAQEAALPERLNEELGRWNKFPKQDDDL